MDYIPLNNHMHVKNHMAMWFLWFLWFLRVECSSNPLYKPLCKFLVFVDLLWFLCGAACGFWSCVDHMWSALRFLEIVGKDINVPSRPGDGTCDFCGSVVLPSMPISMRVHLPRCLMPMIARPLCGFADWSAS